MTVALLSSILFFLALLFALAFWSNRKVTTEADFIVGGRNFNLFLTIFSLFATWFGAGTLMTATDEIREEGLKAIALEPLGAGLCLIIAGFFLAKPLWEMKIFTISDFYRVKFGEKAEFLSIISTIPIYVGWIAVQFVALSELLHDFFGVDARLILLIIALLSMLLTMMGGLWSVTITDSIQMILIILGIILIFFNVTSEHGGLAGLWAGTPKDLKEIFPDGHHWKWLSLLSVAALGNLSGQDLVQRIFSAKNSNTAKMGCIIAGILYVVLGMIPALLGIFSWAIFPEDFNGSVISHLAKSHLKPVFSIIFTMSIFATVFSTITSALLAPSSVIAHNYLKLKFKNTKTITLCRYAVVLMTLLSVIVSFIGENFYSILEASYAVGLVCFFAPLAIGIYDTNRLRELPCLFSMISGLLVWLLSFVIETEFPMDLIAVFASFAGYYLCYYFYPPRRQL